MTRFGITAIVAAMAIAACNSDTEPPAGSSSTSSEGGSGGASVSTSSEDGGHGGESTKPDVCQYATACGCKASDPVCDVPTYPCAKPGYLGGGCPDKQWCAPCDGANGCEGECRPRVTDGACFSDAQCFSMKCENGTCQN